MTHKILLIQGPNLNFLGHRQPEIYGHTTAAELDVLCREHARENGYELEIFYNNTEGLIVDRIYSALEEGVHGVVINPGALSYAGHALRVCMMSVPIPFIEIHIGNLDARNIVSVLSKNATGVIHGFGMDSYRLGLDGLLRRLDKTGWV
ncbi:MAG: 3-dehydroquinate dehydratase [Mesorhizobium amorphae]|nr:MAG: 3-dehydroquinate dehydratase [Mesorhizobium amorphae]